MVRIHAALPAGAAIAPVAAGPRRAVVESPLDQADATVALVREHMEGAAQLKVPLVVGIGVGANWVAAKS